MRWLMPAKACQVQCNEASRRFPHISLVIAKRALVLIPCSVRWLRTMSAGCFTWCHLYMPWGAKKKIKETNLPEVSANLCCASWLTHSCIQTRKLEIPPEIVPTRSDNFIEPKPDEVRWSAHALRLLWYPYRFRNCLKTHRASFQQKQITLWPPWKKF